VVGSGEEPEAITHPDLFVVLDQPVLLARAYLVQVAVRRDRRRWDMAELLARQALLVDLVVDPIDLNPEGGLLMVLGGGRRCGIGHGVLLGWLDQTPRYHTTVVLDNHAANMSKYLA
jgi:hypothetical protein